MELVSFEVGAGMALLVYDFFLGAPGAVFKETAVGVLNLGRGNFEEGMKPFLPALLKGPVKAIEYGDEGILTREDAPAGGFPERTPAQKVLKRYADEIDLSSEYFQLNEKVALAVNFSVTEVASMREKLYQLQELSYTVADKRATTMNAVSKLNQEADELNYTDDEERLKEIRREERELIRKYNDRYGRIYPLEDENIEASLTSRATSLDQITPRPGAGWSEERLAQRPTENPFANWDANN